MFGLHVLRAGNLSNDPLRLTGQADQFAQIVAIDFECHIAAHAGNQLIEAKLNRLAEAEHRAQGRLGCGLDFGEEFRFGLVRIGPLFARLQHNISIRAPWRHKVGRHFGCAVAREHGFYLGQLLQCPIELKLHRHSLFDPGAYRPVRFDCDIAFVQIGDKLRAHARGQKSTEHNQGNGTCNDSEAHAQYGHQHRFISAARPGDNKIVLFLDFA